MACAPLARSAYLEPAGYPQAAIVLLFFCSSVPARICALHQWLVGPAGEEIGGAGEEIGGAGEEIGGAGEEIGGAGE
jgi:hypothetical protein